jgi:phosphatidate cytidylyltransferase
MALNIATLKQRALTALIFVGIMLGGLFWSHWSFFLLFSIIHFGAWMEYQQLQAKIDPAYGNISPFHRIGVRLAGWSFLLFCAHQLHIVQVDLPALGLGMGIIFFFILPIVEVLFSGSLNIKVIGRSLLGLLYISLSLGLVIQLYDAITVQIGTARFYMPPAGMVIWVIASIWINDTMAYLIGSQFGRTPLSPTSPKKTWEGTIGGIVCTVVVMGLYAYYQLQWGPASMLLMGVSALAAIVGTYGDLLESKLKRMAGVKDSGTIMPGHGGFLDRFDSFLIAIPAIWLFIRCWALFL